jgi:hypothetical protein
MHGAGAVLSGYLFPSFLGLFLFFRSGPLFISILMRVIRDSYVYVYVRTWGVMNLTAPRLWPLRRRRLDAPRSDRELGAGHKGGQRASSGRPASGPIVYFLYCFSRAESTNNTCLHASPYASRREHGLVRAIELASQLFFY